MEGKGYDIKNNILYKLKNGKVLLKQLVEFNNKLISENEYLNGKSNGKIKGHYINGVLNEEGEIRDGKLWNIKILDINKNIETEIKDGKGFTKQYNIFQDLLSEAEIISGRRNGKGKE